MKYYVNEVHDNKYLKEAGIKLPNDWPNGYVGLFKGRKWEGRGNFCGWYGAEYYLDTKLLAYYKYEGGIYNPKKRISDVSICDVELPEASIGSCMWGYVIEADTDEEAVAKFIAMDFAKE